MIEQNPMVDAIDTRNELLSDWLDLDNPDAFERKLRIAMQQSAQVKREIKLDDPDVSRAYAAGFTAGMIAVLEKLFREDQIRLQINSAYQANPGLAPVFRYLYEHDGTGAANHAAMAAALDLEYRELIELMAPALASWAVEAYRTGKNARYVLTPAGRRYWRDKTKKAGDPL